MNSQRSDSNITAFNCNDDFEKPTLSQWESLVNQQLKGKALPENSYNDLHEIIKILPIYLKSQFDNIAHQHPAPGNFPFTRGTKKPADIETSFESAVSVYGTSLKNQQKNLKSAAVSELVTIKPYAIGNGENQNFNYSDKIPLSNLAAYRDLFGEIQLRDKSVIIDPINFQYAHLLAISHLNQKNTYLINDPYKSALITGKMEIDGTILIIDGFLKQNFIDLKCTKLLGIDGRVYKECGANIVEELAMTLAAGSDLIRKMLVSNIAIENILPHLFINLSTGTDFFKETVKYRVIRKLWSRIVELFSGTTKFPETEIVAYSTKTNKSSLDDHVNILRTVSETLSAIFGGCQKFVSDPFDFLNETDRTLAYRLALNIPKVLNEEGFANKVTDPVAGSWYLESLTDAFCDKAWKLFQTIEKKGGMATAIQSGFIQSLLLDGQQKQQQAVSDQSTKMVGVNIFQNQKQGESQPDINNQPQKSDIPKAERSGKMSDDMIISKDDDTQSMLEKAWKLIEKNSSLSEVNEAITQHQAYLPIDVQKISPFRKAAIIES